MGRLEEKSANSSRLSPMDDQRRKSEVLIQALIFLQEQWGWSDFEFGNVLHIPQTTISKWLREKSIPKSFNSPDITAIVSLVSIHKSLYSMFSNPQDQMQWLISEHPVFNEAPRSIMAKDALGLFKIRTYLDYVRGRGA